MTGIPPMTPLEDARQRVILASMARAGWRFQSPLGADATGDLLSDGARAGLLLSQLLTQPPAATHATHATHATPWHPDAPLCMRCGVQMYPSGSCYACRECGETSGCS